MGLTGSQWGVMNETGSYPGQLTVGPLADGAQKT
jgi:hypothetical protein